MTSHSQSWPQEAESQLLDDLRARYEGEGFIFIPHPRSGELPDFLGSYVPDALARKPGRNIAIEVKQRQSPKVERALKDIRRLFEGHPDWQFHVVFMGSDPLQGLSISPTPPSMVRSQIAEVRALADQGHRRAAFMMSWALLEAALRSLDGETADRLRNPGTVVQTLAMNGSIEPDLEKRLRSLLEHRNRVVHGDLSVEPAREDIETVLSAIDQTLSAAVS